ncbi:MAG: uroporphyrinogen-III C-methyltransferase [Acidobacteriota bacterium]
MNNASQKTGIVYLVGAGPGHPGLITRWGYDLLQQCDAVAYDALIPMELISGLPERVEKYYVGKRARRHSVPQPQINALLVTLAKRGLNVVRLKGGDPFVFGRIGEEAQHLSDAGIPVVMVPGVTAASAAAAMAGFSLTTRQESSWVFIATGHPAENSSTPVPWDKVASLQGGTLVIYMGIARLESIVEQLISSGMSSDTPAVVVQAASTGLQRSVQAPLNQVFSESQKAGLQPPSLVIIGEPVRCRTSNYGLKNFTLAGKRVLLTGPFKQTEGISMDLREAGAQPLPSPTVRYRRFSDTNGWEHFRKSLNRGAVCLLQNDIDVEHFFDEILMHRMDLRNLANIRFMALGKSVEEALLAKGIRPDFVIEDLAPNTMADCLSHAVPDTALPLIWVQSSRKFPPEGSYTERFSKVVPLAVTESSTAVWDPRWENELISDPPDFIIFTGEPEVEGFADILGKDAAVEATRKSCVVSTDASIEEILQRYGISCALNSHGSTGRTLIGTLTKFSNS